MKKFKASENAKKLEIINSLEAFKKGNKTYQQALAMLYKKEDIESIKDVEENENSSNLNTAKEVSPLTDEKEPITPLNKKPSKKTKKILLGSLDIFNVIFWHYIHILSCKGK